MAVEQAIISPDMVRIKQPTVNEQWRIAMEENPGDIYADDNIHHERSLGGQLLVQNDCERF